MDAREELLAFARDHLLKATETVMRSPQASRCDPPTISGIVMCVLSDLIGSAVAAQIVLAGPATADEMLNLVVDRIRQSKDKTLNLFRGMGVDAPPTIPDGVPEDF